ncbi:MAG TPA: BTAD domain-containing putative transcriptional regulator [Gemmatimonadaceae bacterium]
MTQRSETKIELFLLGGIELRGVERTVADRLLAQAKLSALMALLALAPEQRPQRRDRIVGFLWPELDQGHARTALRKAVHALRAALGADVVRSRGDEEIGLAVPPMWCDAAELAVAADTGKMMRAVELYRGELMPGFHLPECEAFERWLDEERGLARERAAAAAWGLARSLESDSRLTDAGRMARRAVRYSWDDERVLRRTITMLARIGDHAGALRLYDEFAERMKKELDANPSPETVALADSLRPSARR